MCPATFRGFSSTSLIKLVCSQRTLAFRGSGGVNYAGQLEDLEVFGAGGPIVAPADDDIAAVCTMPVVTEIPTFKFKFDFYTLPSFGSDLAHGFAVGKSRLNGFDQEA